MFSVLLFGFICSDNNAPYYKAIDPIDMGYSPFAEQHLLTLGLFYVFFITSVLVLWLCPDKIPPLTKVIAMSGLLLGIGIATAVLVQFSENIEMTDNVPLWILRSLPILNILIAVSLLYRVVKTEATLANQRAYTHTLLDRINAKLAHAKYQPLWALLLTLPLFIILTAILVLLGQDKEALVKVFTETTTWHLSQKLHPPYLNHEGHYLCTVAACGSPEHVKPLYIGQRHNQVIIVNRQLQIANAFEELIQVRFPKLHRVIRRNYDRYGYPLSQKINNQRRSDLVYSLMKPLEYFFLLTLYLFCTQPEKLIRKQYRARKRTTQNTIL